MSSGERFELKTKLCKQSGGKRSLDSSVTAISGMPTLTLSGNTHHLPLGHQLVVCDQASHPGSH